MPRKQRGGRASEELLPARVAALLDEALDLLRARTRGDEQGVGHVDDDEVIDPEHGDEPARARHDDAARGLLGDDCGVGAALASPRWYEGDERKRTEATVTENAGLVRLRGEQVRKRREVADVVPT